MAAEGSRIDFMFLGPPLTRPLDPLLIRWPKIGKNAQMISYFTTLGNFIFKTCLSMHSSRMRTTRLLPVSPSMHCSWGVYLPGGVPAQVPPREQNDRQVQKYYLAPNFVCGR